ncbi:MAG TPA: hypothetical protein VFV50_17295 [Bdellovibrionales bacterium]|nr:hypothetical protein [Bdellovibrionales bacterium]
MKLQSYLAALVAGFLLSACGDGLKPAKTADVVPTPHPIPAKGRDPEVYEVALKTYKLGEAIGDANWVTVPESGHNKPFMMRYKFNSGTSTKLQVMELAQEAVCEGVAPSLTVRLTDGVSTRKIGLIEINAIEQNKDYFIEAEAGENRCSKFMHKIVVWADEAHDKVKPQRARRCSGSLILQLDIFISELTVNSYASFPGSPKYLGYKTFCGETVEAPSFNCTSTTFSPSGREHITCGSEAGETHYSFGIKFDMSQGTANVACYKNDVVFAETQFKNCIDTILDRSQYKQ